MIPILIVDDEVQIRKLLHKILERSGYATIEACNGQEAVEQFKMHKPQLVILDIIMPEKEGFDTIMELKQLDPEVKIIAISGGGKINAKDYLKIAKKLGAAVTIEKPISKHDLIEKISTLLANNDPTDNRLNTIC